MLSKGQEEQFSAKTSLQGLKEEFSLCSQHNYDSGKILMGRLRIIDLLGGSQ